MKEQKKQKKQKERKGKEIEDRHMAKEAVKDTMCQIMQTRQMMTKKPKDQLVEPGKETS